MKALPIVCLALLVTLLNCCKPLTLDDSVYYHYAVHLAAHPMAPYGFLLYGIQPANEVLAPPVLLYWWAAGLRLLGDSPVLWKLWLFPWVLLWVFTLAALGRRFAPRLVLPLVFLIVLSPVFLPALNLMLDIPALTLGLFSLHLFLTAAHRASLSGTIAAGLTAGLAMQTKYTACVMPAVFIAHGILYERRRLALLAAGLALLLFSAWEGYVAWTCGASHLLLALSHRADSLVGKARLILPLVGILGSTASPVLLLAHSSLGLPRWSFAVLTILITATYLLLGLHSADPGSQLHTAPGLFHAIGTIAFGCLGVLLLVLAAAVILRLARVAQRPSHLGSSWRRHRLDCFLIVWLGLEVASYFLLSPYPAVRRVMGLMVVGSLLAGRLAACTSRRPGRRALVWASAGASAVLGLCIATLDRSTYDAEQRLAHQAASTLAARGSSGHVWYCGDGTFGFYCQRAGFTRVQNALRQGRLQSRDWVVLLEERAGASLPNPVASLTVPVASFSISSRWPFETRSFHFGGAALQHHEGPLVRGRLLRVR